jgi:hypothetical protein
VSWVGRRLPRYEDPVLLRGDGRYVADLARGALAMRFVRNRAQLRFAFEQRRVLALCLGDVAGDFRGADDPSGVVVDRRCCQRDSDDMAVLMLPLGLVELDPLAAPDAVED